jgi:APA family basic amino acid/polyamine antiporter
VFDPAAARGQESVLANTVLVFAKLLVLALFVGIALMHFNPGHFTPFAPKGMAGIGTAASSIFFSYIGIDTVATAGDEVENPRRNLPLAIILSLCIVTATYILVAVAAVGAQPWTSFAGQEAGLAVILHNLTGAGWPAVVISAGALASIFSVLLATLYGQTRILYAMSRDGLLPKLFQKVDEERRVPRSTPGSCRWAWRCWRRWCRSMWLVNLTSMGTLIAFAAVSLGVIMLRRGRPDLPRGYRCRCSRCLPVASVVFCIYLIAGLPADTFLLFAVWIAAACLIYFMRNSLRHVAAMLGIDVPTAAGAYPR